MRPLQEVQDIGQLRPFWNVEDFTVHYDNGNYNGWRFWRLGEFGGSEELPDVYDLGRLPLWNLADYGSCQYPRSRCIGERPKHGELETQSSVKENPKAGDITYGEIAHGNDKSRNTGIRDVIARWCYCHHTELRMHFFRMDLMEEGWWSTYQ